MNPVPNSQQGMPGPGMGQPRMVGPQGNMGPMNPRMSMIPQHQNMMHQMHPGQQPGQPPRSRGTRGPRRPQPTRPKFPCTCVTYEPRLAHGRQPPLAAHAAGTHAFAQYAAYDESRTSPTTTTTSGQK